MENERVLDETGGWERIVNAVERHNARMRRDAERRERKKGKMARTVLYRALGAVGVVILALTGLLAPWVAGVTAVLMLCGACLMAGRLLEAFGK